MNAASEILPLELDGICFEAGGKRLIKEISHRFEAGPRTVVLGPNGAGKSLLLRLCHGLLEPSAGNVRWMGDDAARHQAMVFQRPVMLRRSARANVEYALSLKGHDRNRRRRIATDVLEQTGLSHLASAPARVLSFGEQQRLALARAWALRPRVLFLDEPTASLDPAATYAVEKIIAAIDSAGTRIIMTTHDLAQARRIADEILFMHRGRIKETGPAAGFFEAPKNDLARAFINGELLWKKRKVEDR